MAINTGKLKQYLELAEINYDEHDDTTLVCAFADDNDNRIMVVIRLMENGEFLQIHTLKHLDDLVAEAEPEPRSDLLKWMLNRNYITKVGAWEYDPDDHDHRICASHVIEDGDLTLKQFMRLLSSVSSSLELIPEMKKVLGIGAGAIDPVEQKRQELLAQLRALEDGQGI